MKLVTEAKKLYVLIDRIVVKNDEETQFRLGDSTQTAFYEGEGSCIIKTTGEIEKKFSDKFECDGMLFEVPSANFFSFNNPYGACKVCGGFGKVLGIDPDLVIPDKSLSVYQNAVAPWRSETMKKWLTPLIAHADEFDFPIHRHSMIWMKRNKNYYGQATDILKGLMIFSKTLKKNHIKFSIECCCQGTGDGQFVLTVKAAG